MSISLVFVGAGFLSALFAVIPSSIIVVFSESVIMEVS